mgnify:CR=1 FL=1
MELNSILLEKAAEGAAQPQGGGWIMIIYLVVIFGVMYFLLIRPQRKKQKEEAKMRENLQIGDEILTIGGYYLKVVSLKEDSVIAESVADHAKMKVARWAIQQNLTVHDDQSGK